MFPGTAPIYENSGNRKVNRLLNITAQLATQPSANCASIKAVLDWTDAMQVLSLSNSPECTASVYCLLDLFSRQVGSRDFRNLLRPYFLSPTALGDGWYRSLLRRFRI